VIDLTVPNLSRVHQRRSEKWAATDSDVLSSTIAEMDFPLAPPITEALTAAIGRHDLGYAPHNVARLAENLAGFAERRMRWQIDPEQVTPVADVISGLIELCDVLLPAGAPIGFFTPAYPPFFHDLGRPVVTVPLQPGGEPDLEELEMALGDGLRVLILANPHNPTGRIHDPAQLAAIAELCAEYDAWVLSDEIHGPLVLPGADFTPFLAVSDAARARGFVLTSASKAFNVAGLKCAMIVTASPGPREAVRRLPSGLNYRVGHLGFLAAETAFAHGDEWLDAVLAQLDRNRAALGELIPKLLPDVRWEPPRATYLAWLDCRALGLADPAVTFLTDGRVALSAGPAYGPEGSGFVRLNFGTSEELVVEMVRRMAAAVEIARGRG
jgi:cysteine-S-conjugate beta-lyase